MLVGNPIGIMQGRLTPTRGRSIQFFPFGEWQHEFFKAKKLGLDEIEFIFDFDNYEKNPLWTDRGIDEIIGVIADTGVKVRNICADFFMRQPIFVTSDDLKRQNFIILRTLIKRANRVGAESIEIPLLDNSSIQNDSQIYVVKEVIKSFLPQLERYNICLSLEADMNVFPLVGMLREDLNSKFLKAVYDTGNRANLGYQPCHEIGVLKELISNVHIKDRGFGGGTEELGKGFTDFGAVCSSLNQINYAGSFTLQAARGNDGQEEETIKRQMRFLKNKLLPFKNI